jgi:hypothetical protein
MLNRLAAGDVINLQPNDAIGAKVSGFTFAGLVSAFLKLALMFAAIIFFGFLVWGGVEWILSGGDKGGTEKARNRITAALVGLVIVFAAWAIAQLVGVFFDINIFQLSVPQVK